MTSVEKNTLTRLTGRKPDKLAQKVKDLSDVSPKNLPEGKQYHITEKLDGVFAFFLFLEGYWRAFTRTGETIYSVPHLCEVLYSRDIDRKLVIIGELLKYLPEQREYAPVGETSGSVRRYEQDPDLRLVVHDILNQDEFITGSSSVKYMYRITRDWEVLPWSFVKSLPVRVPPCFLDDTQGATQIVSGVFARGGEGIILRDPHATWEAGKRDHRIMRIKQFVTKDLEVVGVKEGVGKMAGMAGALMCRWETPDGTLHEIPVAGGDFAQRTAWLQRPWQIIGKIIEVEAMRMTPEGFLREPRYKGLRFDKTEADC